MGVGGESLKDTSTRQTDGQTGRYADGQTDRFDPLFHVFR